MLPGNQAPGESAQPDPLPEDTAPNDHEPHELMVAVLLPTREMAMQFDPNVQRFYVMSTEDGRPGAEIHGSYADAIDAVRDMMKQCGDEAAAARVFVPPEPGGDEFHDVLAILPRSPSAERVVKTGPNTFTTRNGPWDPVNDPQHETFGEAVIELCELVFGL